MKTIIIVLMSMITSTIFAQDKYDIFMQKMNVQNQIKGFVNNYIDKLAAESNGVTTAQWGQIKSKIDYSPPLPEVFN